MQQYQFQQCRPRHFLDDTQLTFTFTTLNNTEKFSEVSKGHVSATFKCRTAIRKIGRGHLISLNRRHRHTDVKATYAPTCIFQQDVVCTDYNRVRGELACLHSRPDNICCTMKQKLQKRQPRNVEHLESFIRQERDKIFSRETKCDRSPQLPDVYKQMFKEERCCCSKLYVSLVQALIDFCYDPVFPYHRVKLQSNTSTHQRSAVSPLEVILYGLVIQPDPLVVLCICCGDQTK